MLLLAAGFFTLLASPAIGQSVSARGLTGHTPGTERWLVVLRDRGFEIPVVDRTVSISEHGDIVADLDRRMRRDQAEFVAFVREHGGRVVAQWWIVSGCSIEIAPSALDTVRGHPRVAALYPDQLARPHSYIRDSTDDRNHAADAVHDSGFLGKGGTVAVMDAGLDANMADAKRPHRIFFVNGNINDRSGGGIGGSRLIANRQVGRHVPEDNVGHGTALSGVIAGASWGTRRADRGHAPLARIVGYSIANDAAGLTDLTTITTAWQTVARERRLYDVGVVNNSYSGIPDPLHPSQQALDTAASKFDILPVVSAGNGLASTRSSQSCANGLAIGATNRGGAKTVWYRSSRGPLAGDVQRMYPDLVANGVGTVMPQLDNELVERVSSGTSIAAAQVAGAAVLFRSARPSATALETKAAILASTDGVERQNRVAPFNSPNAYGQGYLRDDRLLSIARGRGMLSTANLTRAVPRRSFSFSIAKGKSYAVAIAWNRHIVTSKNWSNLDLEVRLGTRVLAKSLNARNLYEKVAFFADTSGTATVHVIGRTLEVATVPVAAAVVEAPRPYEPGVITPFGRACPSSRLASDVKLVLPSGLSGFGGGMSLQPFGTRPHRVQQVYDAKQLPSPIPIHGISFRLDDSAYVSTVRNHWVDLTVRIGYSSRPPTALSPLFSSNIASPLTTVVPNKRIYLPDYVENNKSVGDWIRIPFSRPFAYTAQSNRFLMLEFVQIRHAFGGDSVFYAVDAHSDTRNVAVSRVYAAGTTASRGLVSPGYGAVVGLLQQSNRRALPSLTATGVPELGDRYRVRLSELPTGALAVLWLGFSDKKFGSIPLPFDLTPLGAPGCMIVTGTEIVSGFVSDGCGVATSLFGVPKLDGLIGATIYFQGAVLDRAANNWGFAYSNGLRLRVGG